VRSLVDSMQNAGEKQVVWDGRDQAGNRMASGIYILNIQAGSFNAARKMILLK